MTDFDPCSYCDAPAIVTVNSGRACEDHIDLLMAGAVAPVRAALRAAEQHLTPPAS